MKTKLNLLFILILLGIFTIFYSLFKGSTLINIYQLFNAIKSEENTLLHQIIFSIRLPRTFSAFITGGLLALSGALMQILLRNPLADPYVLGISGGAAVATMLLLLLGVSGLGLISGAWIGSLVTVFLVFVLAKRNNPWDTQRVLLTGVAIASGFSAFISFILMISPERELRSMLFWLMGDLSYAHAPFVETGILLIGLLISMALAGELNILLRGDKEARALGVNTQRLYLALYFLSSALAAAAVALAGCIGFVGLIVPHLLRLLGLHDQRFLLPASVLLGGILLTFADTLARTLLNPQQLPVGIMMALIGIPVFLFLLQKKEGSVR